MVGIVLHLRASSLQHVAGRCCRRRIVQRRAEHRTALQQPSDQHRRVSGNNGTARIGIAQLNGTTLNGHRIGRCTCRHHQLVGRAHRGIVVVLRLHRRHRHRLTVDQLQIVQVELVVHISFSCLGIRRYRNKDCLGLNVGIIHYKRNGDALPHAAIAHDVCLLCLGIDIRIGLVFWILIVGAISDGSTDRCIRVRRIVRRELQPYHQRVGLAVEGSVERTAVARFPIVECHLGMVCRIRGRHRTTTHLPSGNGTIGNNA